MSMSKDAKAIWFLAFLAPAIAEMLSGSSPIVEWLNPVTIPLFLGMYGAGAILVRETIIRLNKGWASIIVLGAAYGIIEEGIAVKSFFDPGWGDLGSLAIYGRFLDVNWVWMVWLSIFHSMISIALVLLVFSLIYPQYRGLSLLSERRLKIVTVIFVLDIFLSAVLFVYQQDFVPPLAWYIMTFVVVACLVLIARRIPKNLVAARHESPTWSNGSFFALGFLIYPTLFIVANSSPEPLHPVFIILLLLLMSAGLLLLLQHKMGASGNDLPKVYFASGILSVMVVFSFIVELAGTVPSASVGGVIFILFISLMMHKVKGYARPNTSLGPIAELRIRRRRRTDSNR